MTFWDEERRAPLGALHSLTSRNQKPRLSACKFALAHTGSARDQKHYQERRAQPPPHTRRRALSFASSRESWLRPHPLNRPFLLLCLKEIDASTAPSCKAYVEWLGSE